MQVERNRQFSPSLPVFGGMEDYLNMDMLTSQAGASSSSSSSASSHSPRSPPPQTSFDWSLPVINSGSPSDFFNFSPQQGEDFTTYSAPTKTAFDFDFMNTLEPFPYNLSMTAPSGGLSDVSQSINGSIDPQLVGTPTTTARSDFDADDESQSCSALLVIPEEEELIVTAEEPAPKVGGKGRGARKGTVASGGITKKTSSGPSFLRDRDNSGPSSHNGDDDDDDDSWRPTAEEYKKMSSKEKRQLRNKISARNFRVRRKEYITTLESHLADRDSLLETIRSELASSNHENGALRAEIAALKRTLLNQPISGVLPPPGPLPSTSVSTRSPPSSPILASVNTAKDLPTSPRLNAKSYAFWGGAGSAGINMGSGYTPVHTMRTLSVSEVLARKANENINPLLSLPIEPSPFTSPSSRINVNPKDNVARDIPGFDAFADRTPFTMRALDAYRLQLWGKIGASAPAHQQSFQNVANTHPPLTGLAANLRPAYFQAQPPKVSTVRQVNNTVTASAPADSIVPVKEEIIMANLASQTLMKRLGGACWDAFSGGSGSTGPDVEKVKRVLEGKAVLRYVDLEMPVAKVSSSSSSPVPVIKTESPASPKLSVSPSTRSVIENKCNLTQGFADILEQNMRSLTLAAKK